MELYKLYSDSIPDFVKEIAATAPMQRLKLIGMNCGCEYSSTSVFRKIGGYTRFEHSVGAALIVWNFTGDVKQSVSALFHDIATPCFAHVIDFLHGDYESQESTEDRTLEIIKSSPEIVSILKNFNLSPEDVCNYHLFPIADNDTPRLSSDRLEYTLGNGVNYRFISAEKVPYFYNDIVAGINEEGSEELMFSSAETALEFAEMSLKCSKIYCGDEDRYLMQMLAELIGSCVRRNIITEEDLYGTEPSVIEKINSDPDSKADWEHYCGIRAIRTGVKSPSARIIKAKKRFIDPYVKSNGRVSGLYPNYKKELEEYLRSSFDYFVDESTD